MKQTNEEFIKAGYKRFDPPRYEDCVTDLFQKCIRDEDGNKEYFITVERWDYSPISNGRNIPVRYDWTVQLTHKNTRETVNIDCLSGWTIEDAEKFYEDLWNTGWFEYYEYSE